MMHRDPFLLLGTAEADEQDVGLRIANSLRNLLVIHFEQVRERRRVSADDVERRIFAAQLNQAGAEAAAGVEHRGTVGERNAARQARERAARRREDRRVVPGAARIDEREERERQQPRPRRQHAGAARERERERKAAADEDAPPRRRADQRERRADEAGGDERRRRRRAELGDGREDDPARRPGGERRQRPAAVDEAAPLRAGKEAAA